jgi:hypothetical protein
LSATWFTGVLQGVPDGASEPSERLRIESGRRVESQTVEPTPASAFGLLIGSPQAAAEWSRSLTLTKQTLGWLGVAVLVGIAGWCSPWVGLTAIACVLGIRWLMRTRAG